jgi:hypothetical protein
LRNPFVNTAKPGNFTPLCSAPSETHPKKSPICATSLRTHSHTSTCGSTAAPLAKSKPCTPTRLVADGAARQCAAG